MTTERPAIVMPFHDPDRSMFRHLKAILPDLKAHFSRAYLTIPDVTAQGQPENVRKLAADDFFWLYPIESATPGIILAIFINALQMTQIPNTFCISVTRTVSVLR